MRCANYRARAEYRGVPGDAHYIYGSAPSPAYLVSGQNLHSVQLRMQPLADGWDRLWQFLNSGILGSPFTPFKLLTVITLTGILIWVTRRATRWLVGSHDKWHCFR